MQIKYTFELTKGLLKIFKRMNYFKALPSTLKTHLQKNNLCTNYNYSYMSIMSNAYSISTKQRFQTLIC